MFNSLRRCFTLGPLVAPAVVAAGMLTPSAVQAQATPSRQGLETLGSYLGQTQGFGFGSAIGGDGVTAPQVPLTIPTDNQITFDDVLNPGNGAGLLSEDAQRIIAAHRTAQGQLRHAINYLLVNRERILRGEDEFFNEHFGAFYDPSNPFRGQYEATIPTVRLASIGLDNDIPSVGLPGRGVVGADPYSITATAGDSVRWLAQLHPGQRIYVGDPVLGTGHVVVVQEVITDPEFDNIMIILDRFRSGDGLPIQIGSPIYPVVSPGETSPNPSHYDRVLNTFLTIRNLMDSDTTYQGAFADLASLYQGLQDANYPGLSGLIGQEATRRLREAGYSTSDSLKHLQNLMDIANGATDLPLLWTEDNDSDLDGLPDEGSPFYRFMMTLFGDPDNPNVQHVGPGFLDEMTFFDPDFFDSGLPDSIQFDSDGNPIPNSADPSGQSTPLKQWQMLVRSFAESSTNLSQQNVATIGLRQIQSRFFPEGSPGFLLGSDAESFARFADLFREDGPLPPALQEPFGRRGEAGFFPTVREDVPVLVVPTP